MSTSQPPPPNPILSAYEGFVRDTPLVTRYTLSTLFLSWVTSFFFRPSHALSTIPYFCVFKLELYRLIFSPLICESALSLIFAYFCFIDSGKRLEFSLGSTAFGWFLVTIALTTNITFVCAMFALYGFMQDNGLLMMRSTGIWTVLFGIIATECVQAPSNSQKRLFFVTVPTIYYPLALWALFTLIGGGIDFGELIAVGVGYAYGYGHLDFLKVSQSRFSQWEDTILANFTRREGWVVGHAATGTDAWNDMSSSSGGGFGLFQRIQQAQMGEGSADDGRGARSTGPSFPPGGRALGSSETPSAPSFPAGGHALGSAGSGTIRRSGTSEARAAMLEAAERRARQAANQVNEKENSE